MKDNMDISKLTLGTVQLGLAYGIGNKTGKPDHAYSHQLLQLALDSGIKTLDTARDYGEAEQVIGRFENSNAFTVVSKFKLTNAALKSDRLAVREAKESVALSCRTLGMSRIPICLFHKDQYQSIEDTARIIPYVIEELKSDGLIARGGVSVYSPDELRYFSEWKSIQAVQVTLNVFDTRLLQDDLIAALVQHGVCVFARSVYLQGLVTMSPAEVPDRLSFARPFLHALEGIAAGAGISVKQLALSFVRDTPCVSSLVMGAETLAQLEENITLLETPPLDAAIYDQVRKEFANVPLRLITPALWQSQSIL